jgi:hypothetical protein
MTHDFFVAWNFAAAIAGIAGRGQGSIIKRVAGRRGGVHAFSAGERYPNLSPWPAEKPQQLAAAHGAK